MLITEWEKQGLPRDIIKGAVLGSGMYDLKPVRLSKRSGFVKFTDAMEQELSAMRHIDRINAPLVVVHGTLETPEFQRQARDFAKALEAAGKPVKLVVARGYNHYEVGETIGHPVCCARPRRLRDDEARSGVTSRIANGGIIMTTHSSDKLSRRALIAGAAAGTVALAAEPASAQRCPAVPPSRAKGPLVWLDMDQHELDEVLRSVGLCFQPAAHHGPAQRAERGRAQAARQARPRCLRDAEIEKVDIYKTRRANAPVMIYTHGGAWRNGRSAQNAYLSEPFVKAGAHFINVEFNNVGETDGDIGVMVDQCRRAVAWVYRNAASFGGDPNALYLSGHSSGGHLAGCVVITEWEKQGVAARSPQRRAAWQRHV